MAYSNQAPAGDDMMSDSSAGAPEAATKPDEGGGQSVLVPKSACPGMGVGDVIPLKIEQVTDTQYSCTYEGAGADDESQEAQQSAPAGGGGDETAGMME